jgi:hypothetical protein
VSRFLGYRVGHHGAAMATDPVRAGDLLALPVRLHGIQLGRPVDMLLDRQELKVLGLDVLCGDAVHRFLPLPTATVRRGEIAIRSPLVLLEEDELAFYRARAFALSALRGRPVERRGQPLGALVDIVVGCDGSLAALVLESAGAERVVPFATDLRFAPGSRSAA